VLIDIDRFKEINDTIGHNAGDVLLAMVGDRLQGNRGEELFIARLGGNEFAVIDVSNGAIEQLMDELTDLFNRPFIVESLTLDINVSIGGASYHEHGAVLSDLLQAADIALHSSKDSHHPHVLYNEELDTFSLQRLRLMSELKDSLASGQLSLYFQPKMALSDDSIHSVECLIRWIHPEHGFIPPDEFIPLAEQTGAIRHITDWVLRQATIQHAEWRKLNLDIAMAVNISAVDLTDLSLPHKVSALLSEFDMMPDRIILEVTESAVMADPEIAINALNMLSHMGIKLSIDDFGTGFSSMAQLKKMPVDEIKIDKAFVLELATNTEDQVMVKTLIAMAENLDLSTVAEGVENQPSVDLLRTMGCSTAQGFHLSRPLPEEDITPWLQTASCRSCG
jgi:diguanylate cyclase (GGDEF)-like protein